MGDQIKIDEKLLAEAMKLTGELDQSKVIERALSDLIRRHRKLAALFEIAGTVEFHDGYDYKALRASKHDAS